MRTRLKLFSSVIAAIMILTSFSLIVSADTTVYAEGSNSYFDWLLYEDGLLDVYCKPTQQTSWGSTYSNTSFYLATYVSEENLNRVSTVRFDISDLNSESWLSFYGGKCKATMVIFVGPENTSYKSISLNGFPEVVNGENIFFPKGASFKSLSFEGFGIKSFDFLKDISTYSLSVGGFDSLENAVIPEGAKTLSLYSCKNLKKLVLPDKIQRVELSRLPLLTEYNYPRYIKEFYWDIDSVKEITVPYYGRYFFNGDMLEKAELAYGRTNINERMFAYCTSLNNVIIPDTVTTIEYNAFAWCDNLKSVNLPDSITSIYKRAFRGSGLTSVKIPSGVTKLEYGVFLDCEDLQSVYIPKSVTSIDCGAFTRCESLKTVNYGGTKADWEKIMIDDYWGNGYNGTLYDVFAGATINFSSSLKTGWVKNGNDWNYYDDSGRMVTGWFKIDGEWYLFDSKGAMLKDWQKSGSDWYYLGGNGVMRTGWQLVGSDWYYFGDSGVMRAGWQTVDGKWYYFGGNGIMRTGWQSIGGKWYYFTGGGAMVTGWNQLGGTWYYFESSGAMKTGWYQSGSTWYYFGDSGAMKTGWQIVGGKWYYFESSGAMKTGWLQIGSTWYYLDPSSGAMVTGTRTIGGKDYNFDSSGKCTNP